MGVIREVFVPLIAPQPTSVPKGQQAYSVRADQANGETIEFFATIDPGKPEALLAGIFEILPDTVWFGFKQVSSKEISDRGRELEQERAARKMMTIFELMVTFKEAGTHGR